MVAATAQPPPRSEDADTTKRGIARQWYDTDKVDLILDVPISAVGLERDAFRLNRLGIPLSGVI